MNEKNGFGKRFASWITLCVLTFISIVISSIIYVALSFIVELTKELPNFIATVIFYCYWPILFFSQIIPIFKLVHWASDCSESICPSKKGGRYLSFVIYDIILFLLHILRIFRGGEFEASILLNLVFALAFWYQYQNCKE
jgi:hypothetical protein